MGMWPIFIAGIFLGTISSFHCIGMCGPLALALPVGHLSQSRQAIAIMLYQSGRVGTYVCLGLIFSFLGRHIYLAGFQRALSIALGALLLLSAFLYGSFRLPRKGRQPALAQSIFRRLQSLSFRLWQSPHLSRFWWMGMVNGLLPCGMVYLAIAGALSMSRVQDGMLFMFSFGVGTLPALLGITYARRLISLPVRERIRKGMPAIIALMAVLLILRGLNLGIPYIIPDLGHHPGNAVSCH